MGSGKQVKTYWHNLFYPIGTYSTSFWKLGPALPKGMDTHSMVELGEHLYVIGGSSPDFISSDFPAWKEIHKLTCVSGACSWTTLTQQLKVGRGFAIGIPVMDSFCTPK